MKKALEKNCQSIDKKNLFEKSPPFEVPGEGK